MNLRSLRPSQTNLRMWIAWPLMPAILLGLWAWRRPAGCAMADAIRTSNVCGADGTFVGFLYGLAAGGTAFLIGYLVQQSVNRRYSRRERS